MPVTTAQKGRLPGEQPIATAKPTHPSLSQVKTAVERSQHFLLKELKPEGYWVGELMVDSTIVSDTVAYHHWNGKVDRDWERKAVNHILSMQLAEGGWLTSQEMYRFYSPPQFEEPYNCNETIDGVIYMRKVKSIGATFYSKR